MGSAFTSDLAAMTAFAQALKGKGFFFVDSVTSGGTVASTAMEAAVSPRRGATSFSTTTAGPMRCGANGRRRPMAKERGETVSLCHARRRRGRSFSNCSRSCALKGSAP